MLLEVRKMGDGIKVLVGALVGALAVLLLVGTFSGGGMGSMMGGGVFGMFLGLVFWVAGLALIAALVVWMVREMQRR